MGLRRTNPLFVDSTKPVGNKVVTSVELTDIVLQDGDSLYFEILEPSKTIKRYPLQSYATKKTIKYCVELQLDSDYVAEYRFVLEPQSLSHGQVIRCSAYKKLIVGVLLRETWSNVCVSYSNEVLAISENPNANLNSLNILSKPCSQKTISKNNLPKSSNCNSDYFENLKSLMQDLEGDF